MTTNQSAHLRTRNSSDFGVAASLGSYDACSTSISCGRNTSMRFSNGKSFRSLKSSWFILTNLYTDFSRFGCRRSYRPEVKCVWDYVTESKCVERQVGLKLKLMSQKP